MLLTAAQTQKALKGLATEGVKLPNKEEEQKEKDGREQQVIPQPSQDVGRSGGTILSSTLLPLRVSIPPLPIARDISKENKLSSQQSPQSAGKEQGSPKTISNLPYFAEIKEPLNGARVLIPVCLPVGRMESWLHYSGKNPLSEEGLLNDRLSKIEALFFEIRQKSVEWVRFILVDTPMVLTRQNFEKDPKGKLDEKVLNSEITQPADKLFAEIKTLLEKYFPKKHELWRWADVERKEKYKEWEERVRDANAMKGSPYQLAIFDNAQAWLKGKGFGDKERLGLAIDNNVEVLLQECAAFAFFTDEKPTFTHILDSTKQTEAESATRKLFPTSDYLQHVHYVIRKKNNPNPTIPSTVSSARGNTFDATTTSSLHNTQSFASTRASTSQEASTSVLSTTTGLSARSAEAYGTNVKDALTSLQAVGPSQGIGSLGHRTSSTPLSMFYSHSRPTFIRNTRETASAPVTPSTPKVFAVKDKTGQRKVVDFTGELVQAVACVQDPQYAAQFALRFLQLANVDFKPQPEEEVTKTTENMTPVNTTMQSTNGTTVNTEASIYSSKDSNMTVAASVSMLSSSQTISDNGIPNISAMPYTMVNSPTTMTGNNSELQSPKSTNSCNKSNV